MFKFHGLDNDQTAALCDLLAWRGRNDLYETRDGGGDAAVVWLQTRFIRSCRCGCKYVLSSLGEYADLPTLFHHCRYNGATIYVYVKRLPCARQ